MSSAAPAPIGHNSGIAPPPTEQEFSDDLKVRFAVKIEARTEELAAALKEYPVELTLADADRAAALQDLIGQMKDHRSIVARHKKEEKGPWDKIVKVVQNYFLKADERLEAMLEDATPRHKAYMNRVLAENTRKQEAEAERLREAEAAARKRQEEAEAAAAKAAQEEAAARQREEDARAAEAKAKEDKAKAEEAALAAAAEEKRLADARKVRDREEKEANERGLRDLRRYLKEAEILHADAEGAGDDVLDANVAKLDALIRQGGMIGAVAGPLLESTLLDEDVRTEVEAARERLGVMRKALNAQFDAKEKRRRAAAEKKAQEEEAARAAIRETERKAQREAEETAEAEAKTRREAAQKLRDDAAVAEQAAKVGGREARAEARDAASGQKAAGKVIKAAGAEAERASDRAEKIEDRLEHATDAEIAGTLRGELGTKGSLTRHWTLRIKNEEKLRAASGPAGPHFTADALNGAAYRWMLAHQAAWKGLERVNGDEVGLPGVIFAYQQGDRIA